MLRRAVASMLRRVAAMRIGAAMASRRNVVATGPITGNSWTAMAAPTWIDTIDPSRSAVGGTLGDAVGRTLGGAVLGVVVVLRSTRGR
jgi:hypothetical protein